MLLGLGLVLAICLALNIGLVLGLCLPFELCVLPMEGLTLALIFDVPTALFSQRLASVNGGLPLGLRVNDYMLVIDVWSCKYGKQAELVRKLRWWES